MKSTMSGGDATLGLSFKFPKLPVSKISHKEYAQTRV